jgi:hypothetical protein
MKTVQNLKKKFSFILGLATGICFIIALPVAIASDEGEFVPGQVLVKFAPGIIPTGLTTGIPAVDAMLQSYGIQAIERALSYRPLYSDAYDRWWTCIFPENAPVEEIVQNLLPLSGIDHAQVSYILVPAAIPNDTCFGDQWNLHNTGQRGGKEDADIDAPEGWDHFNGPPFYGVPGSSSIIVSVIDTGISRSHPEFNAPPYNRILMSDNGVRSPAFRRKLEQVRFLNA